MTSQDLVNFGWLLIQNTPQIAGFVAAAFVGERNAHKFLIAACQIVFALANEPMENEEKRASAIRMLYDRFPVMARIVPDWLLGKLIDIAWQNVIKPTAQKNG